MRQSRTGQEDVLEVRRRWSNLHSIYKEEMTEANALRADLTTWSTVSDLAGVTIEMWSKFIFIQHCQEELVLQ